MPVAERRDRAHRARGVRRGAASVSVGAVTALHHLAVELNLSSRINAALAPAHVQIRDGPSVGESVLAAIIARVCAPRSKRAFSQWAQSTYLPDLMRFSAAALSSQHFWDQMQAPRAVARLDRR